MNTVLSDSDKEDETDMQVYRIGTVTCSRVVKFYCYHEQITNCLTFSAIIHTDVLSLAGT